METIPNPGDIAYAIRKRNGNRVNDGSDEEIVRFAFTLLSRQINGGNRESMARELRECLFTEHRSLQQQIIGMLIEALVQYGNITREQTAIRVDLRNEQAATMTQAIAEILPDPYVPLI